MPLAGNKFVVTSEATALSLSRSGGEDDENVSRSYNLQLPAAVARSVRVRPSVRRFNA